MVSAEGANLKGWQVYFNNVTVKGRRNVVFAVYGSCFAVWALMKMRKGSPAIEQSK
ncbi:Hypothetical predicted protein [Paramuricea clavata]|uniref:Uncharacterized protein n=1 Tax=Paramuricea clavata TaxID=317549 RepID=A0A7D9JBI6_PARCT|nr:Hypothetical predicted protein [Paramuricea clavata]